MATELTISIAGVCIRRIPDSAEIHHDYPAMTERRLSHGDLAFRVGWAYVLTDDAGSVLATRRGRAPGFFPGPEPGFLERDIVFSPFFADACALFAVTQYLKMEEQVLCFRTCSRDLVEYLRTLRVPGEREINGSGAAVADCAKMRLTDANWPADYGRRRPPRKWSIAVVNRTGNRRAIQLAHEASALEPDTRFFASAFAPFVSPPDPTRIALRKRLREMRSKDVQLNRAASPGDEGND